MKNNLYTIILFSIFAFACADGLEEPDSCYTGAIAQCNDGTYSYSNSRSGACSGNDGVSYWCDGERIFEEGLVSCQSFYALDGHRYSYCCYDNTSVCEWSGQAWCGDGITTHDEQCDGGPNCSIGCDIRGERQYQSWECRQQDAEPRGRCHGNNLIYCDPTGVPRTVVCNSPDLTRRCGIDIENDMFDCLPGL